MPARAIAATRRRTPNPALRVRELVLAAIKVVAFRNAAIPTTVAMSAEGKAAVTIQIRERDSGELLSAQLSYQLPAWLANRNDAVDWIFRIVRHAWVHELHEAFHVSGKRRFEAHDENGAAAVPGELTP